MLAVLLSRDKSKELFHLILCLYKGLDFVCIGELNPNLVFTKFSGALIDHVAIQKTDCILNRRKLVDTSIQRNNNNARDMPTESFI